MSMAAERTTSLIPAPANANSPGLLIPTALANAAEEAQSAFFEFFAATIPNGNTRAAYMRDVVQFFAWCHERRFEICALHNFGSGSNGLGRNRPEVANVRAHATRPSSTDRGPVRVIAGVGLQ